MNNIPSLVSLTLILALHLYVYLSGKVFDTNVCSMSYSSPAYHVLDMHTNPARTRQYRLFRFTDLRIHSGIKPTPGGHAVIFVPGNKGAYNQGRTLGHDLGLQADVYLLDFKGEAVAFSGLLMHRHAEFVHQAIDFVANLYTKSNATPIPMTVVGHSMGGVSAIGSMYSPSSIARISTLITLSSPHFRPVLETCRAMHQFYSFTRRTTAPRNDDLVLVSLSGGYRDMLVPTLLSHIPSSHIIPENHTIQAVTSDIATNGRICDHLSIVWCLEVSSVVNKATAAAARLSLVPVQERLDEIHTQLAIPKQTSLKNGQGDFRHANLLPGWVLDLTKRLRSTSVNRILSSATGIALLYLALAVVLMTDANPYQGAGNIVATWVSQVDPASAAQAALRAEPPLPDTTVQGLMRKFYRHAPRDVFAMLLTLVFMAARLVFTPLEGIPTNKHPEDLILTLLAGHGLYIVVEYIMQTLVQRIIMRRIMTRPNMMIVTTILFAIVVALGVSRAQDMPDATAMPRVVPMCFLGVCSLFVASCVIPLCFSQQHERPILQRTCMLVLLALPSWAGDVYFCVETLMDSTEFSMYELEHLGLSTLLIVPCLMALLGTPAAIPVSLVRGEWGKRERVGGGRHMGDRLRQRAKPPPRVVRNGKSTKSTTTSLRGGAATLVPTHVLMPDSDTIVTDNVLVLDEESYDKPGQLVMVGDEIVQIDTLVDHEDGGDEGSDDGAVNNDEHILNFGNQLDSLRAHWQVPYTVIVKPRMGGEMLASSRGAFHASSLMAGLACIMCVVPPFCMNIIVAVACTLLCVVMVLGWCFPVSPPLEREGEFKGARIVADINEKTTASKT